MKAKFAALQLLRFLAVSLVIAYHYNLGFKSGFIGVDIFFVISGFIIAYSYLLKPEFSLTKFYAKRIRRILPLITLVSVAALIINFYASNVANKTSLGLVLSLVSYTYNFYAYGKAINYWSNGVNATPYYHFWSLSVEEEFYIFFTIMLFLLIKLNLRKIYISLVSIFGVLSLLFTVMMNKSHPMMVFYLPWARVWEFAVGVSVAYFYQKNHYLKGFTGRIVFILSLVVLLGTGYTELNKSSTLGLLLVSCIATAGFIFSMEAFGNLDRRLSVLLYGGDLSYSLYLWHVPIYFGVKRSNIGGWNVGVALLLLIAISILTYHFFENPLRKKVTTSKRGEYIFVGSILLSSILLPLLVVFTLQSMGNNSGNKSSAFAALINVQREDSAKYSGHCHISNEADTSEECLYGDSTAKESMVLYGDSHAAEWFAPINTWAQKNHFRLYLLYKGGCGINELEYNFPNKNGTPYHSCTQWKINTIKRINELEPEVLIATNNNIQSYLYGAPKDFAGSFTQGLSKFHLPSAKLIYILDSPILPNNVADCLLSSYPLIARCNFNLSRESERINNEVKGLTQGMGYSTMDYNSLICPSKKCGVFVDNLLYFKDNSHITEGLSLKLAANIETDLNRLILNK